MEIKKIAVIGPGTMGCGIAQVFAQNGFEVVLIGHTKESTDKHYKTFCEKLEKAAAKGKLKPEDRDRILENTHTSYDFSSAKDCQLVVEAVPEDLKLKKEVFRQLDGIVDKDSILATNTSSLPISEIASATKRPEKVIGLHFFNPVPAMKLVEIVRSNNTSDDTYNISKNIVEKIGKVGVNVKDSPGFVANRMLMLFINEAIRVLEDGIASKEGIDTVAKLGFNHPMGPLELADLVGLDVVHAILQAVYERTKDEKFKPAKLLADMVDKGNLGRKTKKGFYDY